MKRSALFLLATAAACAAAPAATAETPTRVGVDKKHQVSFRLSGTTLVVTLRPVNGKPNPLAKKLSGKRASVACVGVDPVTSKAGGAFRDFTWPKKATSYTGTLNADVSETPDWCVLEEGKPPRDDLAISYSMRIPNPAAGPATAPAS